MSTMRGLTVFISDLRNARARDLEEKRVNTELAKIRAKFRDTKLSGYDRKKYVCKLLYMYILGWSIDFGHLEAVTLISSKKYSEKQVGYLGVTLFLNEHHELLHLVVNSIRKDLLDSNELNSCLALHCIANIGGSEMGSTLAADVHQLLVSKASRPFVKKKAALTLLRLYRKSPGIIEPTWSEKLVSLLNDPDLGVALSVASLVTVLAQDHPHRYALAYHRAVQRLKAIVLDHEFETEYVYYKVACPWLQVKLMRLLMLFPPPMDDFLKTLLIEVLQGIIHGSDNGANNVQQSNAQNAILFQAVDVAMHIEVHEEMTSQIIRLLDRFLKSKETNIRYLGLETLSRLVGRSGIFEALRSQHITILQSLKDRDLSVRRRALDLLYCMCDDGNAKDIISELVQHLQISDYSMREEMVLKIAILVEKFSTAYEWYITITLQLLAIAGNQIADEVWQRVIQVVANNETLQPHAARLVLTYTQTATCHENLIKVAGYVLGEFGHLIANEKGCSPIEQFSALHAKFNVAGSSTRAMLLTTYLKFLNIFPEIKPELTLVFHQFLHNLDAELQQRACEYLALSEMSDEALLQAICEEMPPFPEKASKLISRLYSRDVEQVGHLTGPASTGVDLKTGHENDGRLPAQKHNNALHLSKDWQVGFLRLLWKPNGMLYEDAQIRIFLRSEYVGNIGRLSITLYNKSTTPYSALATVFECSESESIVLHPLDLISSTLAPHSQTQQSFRIECFDTFETSPIVRVVYLAGSLQELVLKLPIVLSKFFATSPDISASIFTSKWNTLDEQIFTFSTSLKNITTTTINLSRMSSIIHGHGWTFIRDEDQHTVLLAAGILNTHNAKVGCLLQVKLPSYDSSLTLEIRAPVPSIARTLSNLLAMSLTNALLPIPCRVDGQYHYFTALT